MSRFDEMPESVVEACVILMRKDETTYCHEFVRWLTILQSGVMDPFEAQIAEAL